ncbi:MAG: nitroreductase family protein [Vampirovibrionales bacterium]|nr:nitroreductase family protein [Vampirovibrionales bacterium]
MSSPTYPIAPLLEQRWSPRAFKKDALTLQQIGSLLEAMRWSASCFNDQPWQVIVGSREYSPQAYQAIFNLLVPFNQTWCTPVPLLILTIARERFAHNHQPNPHAQHDVGMATTQLLLQAAGMGLSGHSMAGFDAPASYAAFNIPTNGEYTPMAVTAIGFQAPAEALSDAGMRERETAPRERNPLHSWAFGNTWGTGFTA